jgi:hypothetical protein
VEIVQWLVLTCFAYLFSRYLGNKQDIPHIGTYDRFLLVTGCMLKVKLDVNVKSGGSCFAPIIGYMMN